MSQTDDTLVAQRLRRLLGISGIILVISTWRLWTPGTEFPRIPFLAWSSSAPSWLDWALMFTLLAALAVIMLTRQSAPRVWRGALIGFVIATALSILLDQHRMQPWIYQLLLLATALSVCRPTTGIMLARFLTISIYFHSAHSKFDFSFFETHGQSLLSGLMNNVGVVSSDWPQGLRWSIAALFPAGEMLIAVGLAWKRTRRVALCLSLTMHVLLIAAVGPFGLDHKPAVLLWNVFFILQNILIFYQPRQTTIESSTPESSTPEPSPRTGLGERLVVGAMLIAGLAPLLEPFGLFDHWPAWGLYASRPEKVHVYVHEQKRDQIRGSLSQHIAPVPFDSPWCAVRIDRWSIDETNAPIYPQERFQVAVALAIAERYDLKQSIRLIIEGPAHRITGVRTKTTLDGRDAIANYAKRFLINVSRRRVEN